MCGRRFSSHVENLAKNKTPGKHRDFMNLEFLVKMHFRKLKASLRKKSLFNCFNFFQFKDNLCFRESVIHAKRNVFGDSYKITLLQLLFYEITRLFCVALLDVPLHVLYISWQRCCISEEGFEKNTKFVTSQKILWDWVKGGLDSRRKKSIKLPKWVPQTVDNILVFSVFSLNVNKHRFEM